MKTFLKQRLGTIFVSGSVGAAGTVWVLTKPLIAHFVCN